MSLRAGAEQHFHVGYRWNEPFYKHKASPLCPHTQVPVEASIMTYWALKLALISQFLWQNWGPKPGISDMVVIQSAYYIYFYA